jgi:hypothetical protein
MSVMAESSSGGSILGMAIILGFIAVIVVLAIGWARSNARSARLQAELEQYQVYYAAHDATGPPRADVLDDLKSPWDRPPQ